MPSSINSHYNCTENQKIVNRNIKGSNSRQSSLLVFVHLMLSPYTNLNIPVLYSAGSCIFVYYMCAFFTFISNILLSLASTNIKDIDIFMVFILLPVISSLHYVCLCNPSRDQVKI